MKFESRRGFNVFFSNILWFAQLVYFKFFMGESTINWTFHDPYSKKYKATIN